MLSQEPDDDGHQRNADLRVCQAALYQLVGLVLTSLAVLGVLAAPAAVLGKLQPLSGVGLALGGDVVAPLALFASQRYRWTFV